jgi:hypothetical protein
MKNLSNADDTSSAGNPEIQGTDEDAKLHTLFKKIETIEPFFVRRIPIWKRPLDIFGSFLLFHLDRYFSNKQESGTALKNLTSGNFGQ